ncbi:MAG TPA: serine hydrolase domain-containing protein [Acidobacteriaceae bacterium]|nr:serine hydrolase domain-containing protein [Acidobacteriaceae bacterium]
MSSHPQPASPTRFSAARAVIEQAIASRAFPGAAWGVLQNGEILALDAAGHLTYNNDSPAVTPATIFDLASVTKVVVTTALAMLLYDRRILLLDALLGDILPGFVIGMRPGSEKRHVTLRTLLAHSSGLPGYAPLFEQHHSPEGLLRAALHLPLEAPPNTRAEYSDIGFILLGKALEVLSGDILPRLFAREIAAPLGLESATFCPPSPAHPHIPPTEDDTTFRHRILQGEVQDENCYTLGGAAGHAGLFAHAQDILRFAACILADGRTASCLQLFQPETVRLFATRQTAPAGTTRALGWDTPSDPSSSGKFFSPSSIGHLGYAGTSLWIDPARQLAVVLLTNRTWPTRNRPDRSSNAIKQVRPAFHDAIAAGLQSTAIPFKPSSNI